MNAFLLKADKIAFTLIMVTIVLLALMGCDVDTNGYYYKSHNNYRSVICQDKAHNTVQCYSK